MAKAIRLKKAGGPEQLDYVTIDVGSPGPDEIQVRQTAIGVNFIDIYQRMGLYPLPAAAIPGVEAVGIVTAVGAAVDGLSVGDRIVYAGAPVGAYATARILPAWRAVKLPAALTDEQVAAMFCKAITAHMLLTLVYPVISGTTILVHGAAGGLGQLMVRWARHLGATVIGTVGSEAKSTIATAAGAHHVIVGRDADIVAAVADLTAKCGVDVAYDGVGGLTLAKTLACVRPFGVVASIGQAAGPIAPINVDDLGPRRSLMLARPSVMAYINVKREYLIAADAVLSMIGKGVLVTKATAYPLGDVARAHADLEAGRTSGSLYLVP